jgi:hypothetical protein
MLALLGTLLAVVVTGGSVGSLLLWLVGIVVCFAIVFAILRSLSAPPIAFTALYVIAGVLALLLAISFFFGGGDGAVIVR